MEIQELIHALNSSDEWESGSALLKLLDAGEEAVNPLLKAVNNSSPGIRGLAVKALELLAGEKSLPILVEKLGDKNEQVRQYAKTAMEKYVFSEALVDAYLQQLKSFNNELVIEVLRCLEDYNLAKVARGIIPLLGHRDYFVRTRAFITLCRIPNRAVTGDLLDYFRREQDEEFRLRCLEVLHYIGDRETIPVLREYLGDRNKFVARAVVWTIGSIGGWEALKVLLDYGVKVKDGKEVKLNLLSEAVGMALTSLTMMRTPLDYLAEKDESIKVLLAELRVGYVFENKYYVFPSPGYFHQQVDKRGLNYRDYEDLFRSPGKKRR